MAGTAPECYDWVYPEIKPVPGSLKGQVVFVSGASRGIGRSIALSFAEAGADLALFARNEAKLNELKDEIQAQYGDLRMAVCAGDATSDDAVRAAHAKAVKELGEITTLVVNAATNLMKPFVFNTMDEWDYIYKLNLKHPMLLAQLVLPSMRKLNKGTIVNIASRAGTVSVPFATAYSATKAGLIRATTCLQKEVEAEGKDGIAFFSLHPGGVATDMTPSAMDPSLDEICPGTVARIQHVIDHIIKDPPELCAATCVYLATGKAHALKGCYFDVQQNLETIVKQSDIVHKEGLNQLRVVFLGSLPDAGEMNPRVPKPQ